MSADKTLRKDELVLKIVFLCVFIFSLIIGIVLTNVVMAKSDTNDEDIQYIEKWTVIDADGKCFETGRTYDDNRAFDESFTLISKLPDKIELNSILCFQNRSDISVFINGELRKDFVSSRDTGIPGGAMKEFYITIPLSEKDAGAELKLVRGKTDWNPFVVSETFVTSETGFYNYMANKYGLSFFLSVILFVASLLATLIGIIMRVRQKRTIDMLYGALGVLDVACWLLAVSQFTPYVTKIYYIDGLMGYLFCMMMPFALLIYINSIQNQRYKKCCMLMFALSLASFISCTVMHFTGIQTFQRLLIGIDSVLAVVILCLIVTVILDAKKGYIKEYPYTAVGFTTFMVMSIIQIITIIFFEISNSELPMLIGLLLLLVFVIIQQVADLKKISKSLQDEIDRQTAEKEQMLMHIVQTLAGTIDAKDTYTNGHSSRVAEYSREIAKRYGYSETEQNDIYMIGLLHDIGKIGVPDAVINKPDKLTDEEYKLIKQHPVMGAKILDNIKEKSELAMGARWHHERYDGKGYPDGISGEHIPEKARIIAVADSYDAMTSYRSYRDPMPQKVVSEEIRKGSGTQFDPRFAEIMLQMISEDKDYEMKETKK